MEVFLLYDLQNVLPLDSLASSHPISVEVDHPKKIKQLFDRISYSKVLIKVYKRGKFDYVLRLDFCISSVSSLYLLFFEKRWLRARG